MFRVESRRGETAALNALTRALADALRAKKDGPFYLALSGGGTAQEMFKSWAKIPRSRIDWNRVRFYWVDERCVGPRHTQSNYRYARDLLFKPLGIPPAHIHRIRGEADPAKEAIRYGDLLKKDLPQSHGLPRFDAIILGVGEDGHTASIFPNQKRMLREKSPCAVAHHPQSGQPRITLTGPVLLNAAHLWVVLIGPSKRPILARLLHPTPADALLPSAYILSKAPSAHIFTDQRLKQRMKKS